MEIKIVMIYMDDIFGGRVSGGCSGGGQCRGPNIDRTMNVNLPDPCERRCDRDCEEEPCVPYGCPVKLYDKCVIYSGSDFSGDGVPAGSDISVPLGVMRRLIYSYEERLEAYRNEVAEIKSMVNELMNSIKGSDSSGDANEEEMW